MKMFIPKPSDIPALFHLLKKRPTQKPKGIKKI